MTCSIANCNGVVHARGWCNKHYIRWKKYRDTSINKNPVQTGLPLLDRLISRIDAGDCWEWTGRKVPRSSGYYGLIDYRGKTLYAHRIVWEVLVGPIPKGLTLDHLCRNTTCVNPDHLEPVTKKENILRGESPDIRKARKNRHSVLREGATSSSPWSMRNRAPSRRSYRRIP